MIRVEGDTVERYANGLKRYIAAQSEDMLVQSFAIGRTGIEGHLNLVDIATTHHGVVEEMLGRATSVTERAQIIHASRDFLLECLGPFEMALRGFRDSNAALQMINQELEDRVAKRTANLAEANAQLKKEIEQRRASERALAQHAERLRMLRSVDQAIVAAHSQAEIADVVLDQLQQLVSCDRASIVQYNAARDQATLLSVRTKLKSQLGAGDQISIATYLAQNPAYAQGAPAIFEDMGATLDSLTPALRTLYDEGIRSHLSIPLVGHGVLIGAFTMSRTTPNSFTDADVDIASEIATQLAIGLENNSLLQTERRRTTELEALRAASLQITARLELQPVLQTITEYALSITSADDAQIFLYDGETLTFGASALRSEEIRPPQTTPHPGGLTQHVARTGERVSIANVNEHPIYEGRSWGGGIISIPLTFGGQVHGVMNLTFDQPHDFTENELRFLDLLSDQASIALHNAQLYQQLHRYTDELEQRVEERTLQLHIINDRISAFFRSSADAIALCDAEGTILQVNPAFEQLAGHHIGEQNSHNVFETLRPTDPKAVADALRTVTLTEQAVRTELEMYGSGDKLMNFDVTFVSLANDSRNDPVVMCTLHDITQRKQLEAELRNALEREREIRELKSRFTSMVSHEFRTPLAIIQSSSDLLARYADRLTAERRNEQLGEIQNQVRNLTSLLDDVLIISRAESISAEFRPGAIDLVQLCTTIVSEIQVTTNSHYIDFRSDGECHEVWADTKLMQQAIRNLLTNAIKYSPDAHVVNLQLTCDETDVIIRVQDHGIGIPEGDRKYLFEAFHRARNVGTISGTGLGLSIVKQAVDLHGGKIDVESELGFGTTFHIRLPR